jgi:hypothetical protein
MGSARTEAKRLAAQKRAEARQRGVPLSEETVEKIRQKALARWAAWREENPKPAKRPPGRPRKTRPEESASE